MKNELAIQGFTLTAENEMYDVDGGVVLSALVVQTLTLISFACGLCTGKLLMEWLGI